MNVSKTAAASKSPSARCLIGSQVILIARLFTHSKSYEFHRKTENNRLSNSSNFNEIFPYWIP